jgi:hypothetical protein
MNKERELHELIHADVDGTISPAGQTRLAQLLSANPEAREEHQRVLRMRAILASLPQEAPPERLSARIMRAVREERARPSMGLLRRLFPSSSSGRTALPYAYAAAAGAAIGILAFHIFTGQGSLGTDAIERDAAATIGSPQPGTQAGHLVLAGGGISGSATLRKVEGTLALDVDFPASAGFGVSVVFDPAKVKFLGLSNRTGDVERFDVADGSIHWTSARPERVTVFLAPRTPEPSQLTVSFSGAQAVGAGSLNLPGRD